MKPLPAAFLLTMMALASAPATAQMASQGGGKFFDATDANKDGRISKAEWTNAGRNPQGFAMMDLNKDGFVTRAEGRAAMQKVMEMRSAAGK